MVQRCFFVVVLLPPPPMMAVFNSCTLDLRLLCPDQYAYFAADHSVGGLPLFFTAFS